ncbi:hypothetical protein E6C48_04120 [Mesorhizobium composti]|uniref:Uncharacterized protein n=1 Tax=Ollibium composti TaxID=2675109 RepID=A0ABY2QDX1_9HYPH|nr:hypothetical protein E6C48_04120 [Mesorhizobium composti]
MFPNEPSYKLTFDDAVEVHRMLWEGWFQNRIAAHFDVNPARVSDVKHKRTHMGSYEAARSKYGGRAA